MDDGRKLVFEISDGDYKALKKFPIFYEKLKAPKVDWTKDT